MSSRPSVLRTLSTCAALLCAALSHDALASEAEPHAESGPGAHAEERLPGRGFSIAARGGVGVPTSFLSPPGEYEDEKEPAAESTVLIPGVGLRASYTTRIGLSLGASFDHHFRGGLGMSTGLTEVGWVVPVGPLLLEPFAGVGVTAFSGDSGKLCNTQTGECSTVSPSTPYAATIGTGLSLTYEFYEAYFAGVTAEAIAFVAPMIMGIGSVTVGGRF